MRRRRAIATAVTNSTTKYVPELAELLADAAKIPATALTGLIASHVTTTKAVVDAQAQADPIHGAQRPHLATRRTAPAVGDCRVGSALG